MDRKAFYDAVRTDKRIFRNGRLSAGQVEGMEGILGAFITHGDDSVKTLAYALATAYHETARRMMPVREGLASTDAGARRAVNALARRRGPNSAVADYAKPDPVTGHVYYGRGQVQLTWKENYADTSNDVGIDLVANPDAMLDPVVSAKVLIRGLIDGRWNGAGRGIGYYLAKDDLKNARRTVNITDKWEDIEEYYQAFLSAINRAGGAPKAPKPTPRPEPTPKLHPAPPADTPSKVPTGIIAALTALVAAIAAALGVNAVDVISKIGG